MFNLTTTINVLMSELYNKSSNYNWDAIMIIVFICINLTLIIINIYYSKQINRQIKLVERDRFAKEMDKLVGPLYSEIREKDFLSDRWLKSPINIADENKKAEFEDFWLNIEKYKYLTSESLRVAIDNYRNTKHLSLNLQIRNAFHNRPNPKENDINISIDLLHTEIMKRYKELQTILSNEQMGREEKLKNYIEEFWPFSKYR